MLEQVLEYIGSNYSRIEIIVAVYIILIALNNLRYIRYRKLQYRYAFIKAHPGKIRAGKRGRWYRCAQCGRWCGRSGSDRVDIPESIRMECDHIRPWYNGGSDKLWNLQALCHNCNRSKSDNATFRDKIKSFVNLVLHPVDTLILVPIRKSGRHNKILKKVGITSRK